MSSSLCVIDLTENNNDNDIVMSDAVVLTPREEINKVLGTQLSVLDKFRKLQWLAMKHLPWYNKYQNKRKCLCCNDVANMVTENECDTFLRCDSDAKCRVCVHVWLMNVMLAFVSTLHEMPMAVLEKILEYCKMLQVAENVENLEYIEYVTGKKLKHVVYLNFCVELSSFNDYVKSNYLMYEDVAEDVIVIDPASDYYFEAQDGTFVPHEPFEDDTSSEDDTVDGDAIIDLTEEFNEDGRNREMEITVDEFILDLSESSDSS